MATSTTINDGKEKSSSFEHDEKTAFFTTTTKNSSSSSLEVEPLPDQTRQDTNKSLQHPHDGDCCWSASLASKAGAWWERIIGVPLVRAKK